ncbi:MAG TPA: hypothetical protein VLV31_02930 [Candidatus Acidoferrales bacterium]|nr:hypothetical protein [Candidatus Acidoferrales bacterium]
MSKTNPHPKNDTKRQKQAQKPQAQRQNRHTHHPILGLRAGNISGQTLTVTKTAATQGRIASKI